MEIDQIYQRVAEKFSEKVHEVFTSEETLKAEFEKNFHALPFTRTEHWQPIVHKMFRDVWLEHGPEVKGEPTGYDKMVVMRKVHSLLDYNLFTQILLNLQNYLGMGYDAKAAKAELDTLQENWPKEAKLNPFTPGSKMIKKAAGPEEVTYNTILSTMRAHKIITEFGGGTSFRVSPKGSTPAFADSQNLSMIGVGGDKYLRTLPNLAPYYLTWENPPAMALSTISEPDKGMAFDAAGIPYRFFSKSGGEILQEVLFARKLMYEVFKAIDITQKQCIQIPRMNSLLIITTKPCPELKAIAEELQKQYPEVKFWEGVRS